MKTEELGDASLETLTSNYASAAAAHGLSSTTGDHCQANKEYKTLAEICKELRRRGIDAQKHLLSLLDNKTPYVRLWAASHSLEFSPKSAENVLEHLAKCGGVPGFDAEITLQEWRKGTLKFP